MHKRFVFRDCLPYFFPQSLYIALMPSHSQQKSAKKPEKKSYKINNGPRPEKKQDGNKHSNQHQEIKFDFLMLCISTRIGAQEAADENRQ